MLHSTTNTYILKREILNFSNKISRKLSKPDRKFTADMTYGMLASNIQTAAPVKEKAQFCYYRLAKGISGILSYAKEGVRLWFRTKRPAYRQLCFKLVA